MLCELQNYDIQIKWKPGKELIIADQLSRACLPYQYEQHNRICSIIKDINEIDPLSNLTITNKKLHGHKKCGIKDE